MVKNNNHFSDKAKKDLELVNAAISGDQIAYAKLMERHRDSIYYMMLKMVKNEQDAEDLTIEAFGKAFSRLKQYTPVYAFSTWLYKIATNNCIDFIRKKRIEVTSMEGKVNKDGEPLFVIDPKCTEKSPEEEIIHLQKVKHMRDLVEQLKPRYKVLVQKRYFEELSYEEIATELNLPLGTVKAQLFRARDFLAKMIENNRDRI